jgi:hypothetical protein
MEILIRNLEEIWKTIKADFELFTHVTQRRKKDIMEGWEGIY